MYKAASTQYSYICISPKNIKERIWKKYLYFKRYHWSCICKFAYWDPQPSTNTKYPYGINVYWNILGKYDIYFKKILFALQQPKLVTKSPMWKNDISDGSSTVSWVGLVVWGKEHLYDANNASKSIKKENAKLWNEFVYFRKYYCHCSSKFAC